MQKAVREERAAMVRHCLGTLAARDRHLLMAFYFGGRTLQDIGREQVIPPGTVKSRLHAARTRLRVRLERAGLRAG
jgi:RNA polymerase sigma factor (sigma-70 family)